MSTRHRQVVLWAVMPLIAILAVAIRTAPVPAQSGPPDLPELEAFLDGVMAAHLAAYSVPGAAVAVVKDEQRFAKGYGYADLQQRRRVDPDRTTFRIASISKLFIWTAVMQLVERGKLDLNADLNTYLTRFKIPPTYPQPITMAHLMSHTAGFEDKSVGLFAHSPESLKPLGELLSTGLPARVLPPGQLP